MASGSTKSGRSGDDDDLIVPTDEASIGFVRALVARGEAVRLPAGAALPPKVTHEIVGETAEGVPILKRRRFALF
jgi:hypothetical protein